MTAPSHPPMRVLPARASLESLRKQAKRLVRAVAAGDADAAARARLQVPKWEPPLSQRDAQLVLAREYGFAGWPALKEAVLKRAGGGLEWAALQAERAIHDNDLARLERLLADHPRLLAWRDEFGRVLLHATTAFAMDVSDPERERQFYRPDCAAFLIDAGAVVDPSVWEGVIATGAAGMLQLMHDRGVLPPTLPVLAALGDADGVRAALAAADDLAAVTLAFMNACRFRRAAVAPLLLDRAIRLDGGLGREIDRWRGRAAFVAYLFNRYPPMARAATPWRAFVMGQLVDAMDAGDRTAFAGWLDGQPWLLAEPCIAFQVELLEQAAVMGRGPFIRLLLDRDPAVARCAPPPRASALVFAFEYGHGHLAGALARIWPLPDDLPHAAGSGDLARVQRWFDADGRPALGPLAGHHPTNDPGVRHNLYWGPPRVQQVLDVALAWACVNGHFAVASFLLAHGADVNTSWSTHEPASILHECALHGRYEAAQFLIDQGIDLTIRDFRWGGTAEGWAYNAAKDERMTELLADAQRQRDLSPSSSPPS